MKFCLVTTFYPPYNFGGDGIYAHRLANGLAKLGHRVTVLHSPTAYVSATGKTPSTDYNNHPNVTVKPVSTPLGKLGLLAVQQTGHPCFQGSILRKELDQGHFDVIHYNNVSLLGGPHVFRYGKGLKLCTLIEHWLICPMHVLWKMDREVCTKPSCFRCSLNGHRPPQAWRYTGLMKRSTKHIDAFLGPSMFTMDKHKERGLKGLMIQLPLFHPMPQEDHQQDQPLNNGRPYFLFAGRLEKIKGVQNIIPIFRSHANSDLLIAGTGNYEHELRDLARGCTNIHFLDRVNHGTLHSLYQNAIATIVPSLCYETFGLIVAESFAANTPVIAIGHSSLLELINTYGGGLTYKCDSELIEAIQILSKDSSLRNRLASEGRTAYESEFSENSFLHHYLEVVEKLLQIKKLGVPIINYIHEDSGESTLAKRHALLSY